jgi:hypothetical protein
MTTTQRVINRDAFFQKVGYKAQPKQQLYHNSKARFRIPVCGRRFGKSTMAGKDLEPKLFIPKKWFWIVGPTYDLGEKEFRVIWDDLIVGQGLGKDKRVKKAYNKRSGEMYIEFPWRTRLEVRSADHPELLIGEGLDGVIMSEAAKHRPATWERFIRPALSDKRGWADFPTTPDGFNWLYDLWAFGQNPEFEDYESWRFPSWDNRIVYPGGYEDPEIQLQLKTTPYEWFMQEIAADFSAFVGKIYGEWDESVHVTEVKFNPAWPSYVAFDWGFTNPLAAVFFQVSPWDDVYVWREHYLAYTRLEQHLNIIKGMDYPDGYHLDLAFGDAADPEAAETVSAYLVPCMADPMAKDNWRQGIDLVKRFLRLYETGETDEFGAPMYKPKLFVDHSCRNTIREFNNYRATEQPNMHRRESGGTGPTDRKIDDHTLDALRYGLVHLFELGAKHHLSEVTVGAGTGGSSGRSSEFSMVLEPTSAGGDGGIFTMGDTF